MKRKYKIIGAASGWGAPIRSCEEGPVLLKEKMSLSFLQKKEIAIEDWETLFPHTMFREKNISLSDALPVIIEFNKRLSNKVNAVLQKSCFPVVLGGDHSNALGTWNGVAQGLTQKETTPFGLIWIDAHMDSHTTETTPSGAWHGMSLAGLLGFGISEFRHFNRPEPVLKPEHLCLIGIRSFEKGEEELLKQLRVKIYYIDEVKKRGLKEVLKEAIAYVNANTQGFGVSLDLDVIDPSEAPGTGCFVPNGLSARELISCLSQLSQDKRLKAFELVEFDPLRDRENRTLTLCQEILTSILVS